MESDVRMQFESGHADLKDMIGFQFALPLNAEESGDELEHNGGEGEEDGSDAAERLAAS